jgi:plastocyanin
MKNLLTLCFLVGQFLAGTTAYATVHIIEARNFFYAPATLTIDLGDTVRFVRIAGTHPTESSTGAWPTFTLNSTLTSYDFIPTAAGNYPYICTIHSGLGMVGSFTVVNTTPPCSATSPPTGLSSAPGTTSAVVSWNFLPNTQLYQLQGRPAGTGPFRKRTTTATSVNITGLLPASTYEWQVRALCVGTDEITIWSPLATFSTLSLRKEPLTPSTQPELKAWQNGSELSWTCSNCPVSGGRVLVMDLLGRILTPAVAVPAGETAAGNLPLPGGMNGIVYVMFERNGNPIAVPVHVYLP